MKSALNQLYSKTGRSQATLSWLVINRATKNIGQQLPSSVHQYPQAYSVCQKCLILLLEPIFYCCFLKLWRKCEMQDGLPLLVILKVIYEAAY